MKVKMCILISAWYVFLSLADLSEMTFDWKGTRGRSGGGCVVLEGIDCVNMRMLEPLHKDYKNAVGISLLNYCGILRYAKPKFLADCPISSRTRTPLREATVPDNCFLQQFDRGVQHHHRRPFSRRHLAPGARYSEFPPCGGMPLISSWTEWKALSFSRNRTRDFIRQVIVPALHHHSQVSRRVAGGKDEDRCSRACFITAGEYGGSVGFIQRTAVVIAEG
jgi:hypothetical protein